MDSNPHQPVSETGASARLRHIRPLRPNLACSAGARPPGLPTPRSAIGVDEEGVDPLAVGLGRQRRPLEGLREALLHLVDLCDRLLERLLAEADRHHTRTLRIGHRERQPSPLQELEALVAETSRVHRLLRVVAVSVHELGPVHPLLPTHPEQTLLLAVQIAEVAAAGPSGQDRRSQLAKLPTEVGLHEHHLLRSEEEQQDRRMPLESEPHVLPEAVGDKVEVARARTDARRPLPLDEVLEAIEAAADPTGSREPEQVLRRLDEDRHLVAVVLPAVVQAVKRRAHGGSQDRSALDELSTLHRSSCPFSAAAAGRAFLYSAPRANSEISCGVAVSKPTTSS